MIKLLFTTLKLNLLFDTFASTDIVSVQRTLQLLPFLSSTFLNSIQSFHGKMSFVVVTKLMHLYCSS